VSYAKPVKRLDRIIEGLTFMREQRPDLNVQWTHIGDGPLLEALKRNAAEKGLQVQWLGQQTNRSVFEYYQTNPIDVFLNTSESEGVPVSIMEALSFGVPVVATDVGGTSEIVQNSVGFLLDPNFSNSEFLSALLAARQLSDRESTRAHFRRFCWAGALYPAFVTDIVAQLH
jgi:glycosyltransferase involved in cell wall biosynthesis